MTVNERTNKMLKVLAKREVCMHYRAFPEFLNSSEASVWYPDPCWAIRE